MYALLQSNLRVNVFQEEQKKLHLPFAISHFPDPGLYCGEARKRRVFP